MAKKLYDLSPSLTTTSGAVMWPKLAPDVVHTQGPFSRGVSRANTPSWPLSWRTGVGFVGHMHGGTHVDAPIYCIDGGVAIEKVPLENLYGTGVVVDMRYLKKWDKITAEDFEKAKPSIQEGDFVVVNTGWQRFYGQEQNYVYYHHYPGLVPTAAEWLIKKKVKAVAGTWPTCDHSLAFAPLQHWLPHLLREYKKEIGKDPGEEFPSFEPCLTKLIENGISCIQNAGGDIDQVTGQRCILAAFPFVVERADAGMVRLVAIFKK
ncbi:cyclase family protein [Chloroflexota bacterium]